MINTVRGPIKKEYIGMTLSHEHFKWECDEDFALRMYYDKQYNENLNDEVYEKMIPLMKKYKELGCNTIVETSPPIGGQNLSLLKRLSDASDVNIIPCIGLNVTKYASNLFPDEMSERLAARWIQDFNNGIDTIDDVVIRPSYIKILLNRGETSFVDKAILKAGVKASNATGMPIHCHIMEAKMVKPVLDLVVKEGMDLSRFLWAHGDHEGNIDTIVEAVAMGVWVGIDAIRSDVHVQRCELLKELISRGVDHRLLLSQDYDFYDEMQGENGIDTCTSLFTGFVPYCISQGIDSDRLKSMLSVNPGEFYDIK